MDNAATVTAVFEDRTRCTLEVIPNDELAGHDLAVLERTDGIAGAYLPLATGLDPSAEDPSILETTAVLTMGVAMAFPEDPDDRLIEHVRLVVRRAALSQVLETRLLYSAELRTGDSGAAVVIIGGSHVSAIHLESVNQARARKSRERATGAAKRPSTSERLSEVESSVDSLTRAGATSTDSVALRADFTRTLLAAQFPDHDFPATLPQ